MASTKILVANDIAVESFKSENSRLDLLNRSYKDVNDYFKLQLDFLFARGLADEKDRRKANARIAGTIAGSFALGVVTTIIIVFAVRGSYSVNFGNSGFVPRSNGVLLSRF
jgi:hypothetical protein